MASLLSGSLRWGSVHFVNSVGAALISTMDTDAGDTPTTSEAPSTEAGPGAVPIPANVLDSVRSIVQEELRAALGSSRPPPPTPSASPASVRTPLTSNGKFGNRSARLGRQSQGRMVQSPASWCTGQAPERSARL